METSDTGAGLVGREREVAALTACLRRLERGEGRLALLGGEAGVGKTALVTALAGLAEQRGAFFALGHAYEMDDAPPYGPWRGTLGRCAAALPLPPSLEAFLASAPGPVSPVNGTRYAFFESVVGYVRALSEVHRPVLALEDLHAADRPSLDLLRFVAHRLGPTGDLAALLVVTYRHDELHRRHPLYTLLPRLGPAHAVERISLGPLSRPDVVAFLRQRFPGLERSEALVTALYQRTEGNPFFLQEVLRSLAEAGRIYREGGREDGLWMGEHPAAGEVPEAVPEAVKEVLAGRLNRLGPATVNALAAAAVLGAEFEYDLLAEMLGLPEDELGRCLDEAVVAHLVREVPGEKGVGCYAFTHALVREVLQDLTVLPRRRQLHRAAARAIQRRYAHALEAHVEELALHLSAAGDVEQAPEFLLRAGIRATHLFAHAEAARHYHRALELLELRGATGPLRDELLTRAAWVLRRAQPDLAAAYLEEALQGFTERRDDVHAAWAQGLLGNVRCFYLPSDRPLAAGLPAMLEAEPRLRDEPVRHAWLASSTAQALANAGRFTQAEPYALAALESAERADSDESRGYAFDALGMVCAARGDWQDARRHFEAGRAAFVRLGYVAFANVLLYSLLRLVYGHYLADRVGERRRWRDQMRDYAERLTGEMEFFIADTSARLGAGFVGLMEGNWTAAEGAFRAVASGRWHREAAQCGLARIALARGQHEQARRALLGVAAQPEGERPGDCFFAEHVEAQELWARAALAQGDLDDARRWLEVNDRFLKTTRYVPGLAANAVAWAGLWRLAREAARARERLDEAVDLARHHRDLLALAPALRERATLRPADDTLGALADLEESRDLAVQAGAPYEQALAEVELAAVRLRRAAQDVVALEMLERAAAVLARLGAAPALERTRALGARPGPEEERPAGLTPRELEVLRLVAGGHTNREIASRLVLSEKTVDRHVSNIFHKLAVDNRSGATAYAYRHGLVVE